jgi:integrase/recombinase XerD
VSSASEFEAWVDDYLDYLRLERNLSENSIAAYNRDLLKLLDAAEAARLRHPDAVDEAFLNTVLAQRARQGDSPRSRARFLSLFTLRRSAR